jgi:hypothetical protein
MAQITGQDKLTATVASYHYQLPVATEETLGGIKVGSGLSVDSTGKMNTDSTTIVNRLTNSELAALLKF